ncbi:MAG: mevalonate kinase [Anaerolineaceae bacterium]|jgi:mevalonate kinase
MPAVSASAPGKIILFGEHAVVYERPAIAIPVHQVQAKAIILANPKGQPGELKLQAPAVQLDAWLADLPTLHPLAKAIDLVREHFQIATIPACTIRITSTIPVAAGLGSGAAVSVALIRALGIFLGHPLPNEQVTSLAYEVEKIHHSNPSGIDNTVITFEQPIFFIRNKPFKLLKTGTDLTFLIADTGVKSSTAEAVNGVRRKWESDMSKYEGIFDSIGQVALEAKTAIENGPSDLLGNLMTRNQALLKELGVSSPELDTLVEVALSSGALGAKLSGAGLGGNMIALTPPEKVDTVKDALLHSGAANVIITHLIKS